MRSSPRLATARFGSSLVTAVCFVALLSATRSDAETIDIDFQSGLTFGYLEEGWGWYPPSDYPEECFFYQEQGFELWTSPWGYGFDFDAGGLTMRGDAEVRSVMLARIDGQPFSLTSGGFELRYLGTGLEVHSDLGAYLLVSGSGVVRFRGPHWHGAQQITFQGDPNYDVGDVIVLRSLTVRVPEPVALFLLGVGALGVAFRRSRR